MFPGLWLTLRYYPHIRDIRIALVGNSKAMTSAEAHGSNDNRALGLQATCDKLRDVDDRHIAFRALSCIS